MSHFAKKLHLSRPILRWCSDNISLKSFNVDFIVVDLTRNDDDPNLNFEHGKFTNIANNKYKAPIIANDQCSCTRYAVEK